MAAAVLQGAAQRLAATANPVVDPLAHAPGAPGPTTGRPGAPATSNAGFLTELLGATTALLYDTLGEVRLKQLRAEGEAMDYDRSVAYALDAIARVRAGTSS